MRLPRQRTGLLAVGGFLVAGTLLVGGMDQDASSQVLAGTCVDKDARPAACADAIAVYQVLTTAEGENATCPAGDYVDHVDGGGLLCLGYNVAAGDCVQDDPEGPQRVPCPAEAHRPTIRILKIVENRATASACKQIEGRAVVALTYSDPAQTLCIAHQPLAAATN